MTRNLFCAIILLSGVCTFRSQVSILGNEIHPSDVSNTGTVTGDMGINASGGYFMWTPSTGITNIGNVTTSYASGTVNISADGSKISLSLTNPATNLSEMTLYNVATQAYTYLGGIGASLEGHSSSAYNISSDGNTVVGLGYYTLNEAHPLKWTQATGIVDLGTTVPGNSARANAVNADGSVIGGWQQDGNWYGAVWKNGVQTLIMEDTVNYGLLPTQEVTAVSDNGVWAVGSSYLGYAHIWSEATGLIQINHPNVDINTGFTGAATGVNADGTKVVGYFRNIFVNPAPDSGEGFIWTPTLGRVELTAYVQSLGINTQGVTFNLPTGISPNGKYIVGWGKQNGNPVGFRLELPSLSLVANEINKKQVIIYPNPVKDIINISGASVISDVEIFDISGRKVFELKKVNGSQINIKHLEKGTYLLKGIVDKQVYTLKMIKD
ncbi:T9SS type A sorting domain-containing protein [Chryseobacterium sp. M5A1_1a]